MVKVGKYLRRCAFNRAKVKEIWYQLCWVWRDYPFVQREACFEELTRCGQWADTFDKEWVSLLEILKAA